MAFNDTGHDAMAKGSRECWARRGVQGVQRGRMGREGRERGDQYNSQTMYKSTVCEPMRNKLLRANHEMSISIS
jgi:hypothetical protein